MAGKKVNKMRGSRTHGYGSKKKHRGGGSRGGRGYAGMNKHKFSLVVTKNTDHFGSKGFFNPTRKEKKAINIEKLDMLEKDGIVDLSELGYDKLLSRGNVTKKLNVRVGSASKKAREKIEKADGKIIEESNGSGTG